MPGRKHPASSRDDADQGPAALQAQQRIFQLRKKRDERVNKVKADFDAALEDVHNRIVTYQEQRLRQNYKKRGNHVLQIMESTEQRKNIETEMLEVVVRMHTTMGELEEMMLAGYRGREDEAAASLQANT